MSVRYPSLRAVLPVLLLGGLFCASAPAAVESERELYERNKKPLRDLGTQLFKGDVQAKPDDKEHVEAIDIRAKYATYPFSWQPNVHISEFKPGAINKLFESFEGDLDYLAKYRDRTGATTQIFCRKVIEHSGEVIAEGKMIASINVARLLARIPERMPSQTYETWVQETLPRLAEGNGELLATGYLTLLKTKGNEAVKYHVLRGLRHLLSLPPQTPPLVKKDTAEAIYKELATQIQQKVVFPVETPKEEVAGYQVVRREMLRVLALNRQPVLDRERPVLTLLRFAGADTSLSPAPRLDERIEAAIGLARQRPEAGKALTYQPDYAAAQIGNVVFEVCVAANAEDGKPLILKSKPWKVIAARLLEALEEMKAEVKNDYVASLTGQCLPQLAAVETGKLAEANNLQSWLEANPPPSKELFRGEADTAVKAPKSE